jgi:hypothetical protein
MYKWLVLFLFVSWESAAVAQQVRIGKAPRPCTAAEITARQSELPDAIPLDPKAAADVVSAVLGCNARPILAPDLTRRAAPRSGSPATVSLPGMSALINDRQPVKFRSRPNGAEIWISEIRTGITADGFGVRPNALSSTVLKKEGFEDCSFGEWSETGSGGDRVIFCELTPEVSSPSQSGNAVRFAVYPGVDLFGSDIARVRAEDVNQCLTACLANDQCRAITFNTDPQVTRGCFLKGDRGTSEFYEQAISVIVLLPGEDEALTVGSQRVSPAEVRTRQ